MKLRRGRASYKIPAHSQIVGVHIGGNQKHNQMVSYAVMQVRLEEIGVNTVYGFPTRWAVTDFGTKIVFKPVPDKAYNVTVRYLPPMMEF